MIPVAPLIAAIAASFLVRESRANQDTDATSGASAAAIALASACASPLFAKPAASTTILAVALPASSTNASPTRPAGSPTIPPARYSGPSPGSVRDRVGPAGDVGLARSRCRPGTASSCRSRTRSRAAAGASRPSPVRSVSLGPPYDLGDARIGVRVDDVAERVAGDVAEVRVVGDDTGGRGVHAEHRDVIRDGDVERAAGAAVLEHVLVGDDVREAERHAALAVGWARCRNRPGRHPAGGTRPGRCCRSSR